MIHKRPFVDDDFYEASCKHPRRLEHTEQVAPIAPLDDACREPMVSDGEDSRTKGQDVERSVNDPVIAVSNDGNNFESGGASGCFPHFLWINNGILEADNLSLFPEYFDHGHHLRAILQPDEAFSSLDYPFQKPVSIGPEHQAFVPGWEGTNTNPEVDLLQSSSSSITVDDGYEERLMGTCIIPVPELEVLTISGSEGTKTDCSCLDLGSNECVKRHIMEARQKLRESHGEEIFEGLGFYDMGECVAKKWTEGEEQVFHDIVLANPASMGKNFWDHLLLAFPSRTKQELVSYYFNVFMLRKRSEQNRFDPLYIDSDNDEWQRSEAGEEEDEDSAVESLNGQEAPYFEDRVDDYNEHIEDEDEVGAFKESADDDVQRVATDEEYEGDLDDVSAAHVGVSSVGCGGDTGFKLFKQTPCNNGNDCDIEDDSCTSYEYQHQHDNVDYSCPLDIAIDGRHSAQE